MIGVVFNGNQTKLATPRYPPICYRNNRNQAANSKWETNERKHKREYFCRPDTPAHNSRKPCFRNKNRLGDKDIDLYTK